jgi:Fe-S cluster assembly ATP-binding protein
MMNLVISNLWVSTSEGKEILKGLDLKIQKGEIHAVMGPNGSGKSTLAAALMGHPGYKITKGKIILEGKDITNKPVDERAKMGLFLGFQYPVEVAGVNFAAFLRMAVNEKNKNKVSPIAFREELAKQAQKLALADEMAKRSLNEGFSGGEKKKSEILQMTILKPKYAILDEPDSGLDVDALKYIAKTINDQVKKPGILLVTHYQRILHYIQPDQVHILVKGKIVKSGGKELADKIEKEGYEKYQR